MPAISHPTSRCGYSSRASRWTSRRWPARRRRVRQMPVRRTPVRRTIARLSSAPRRNGPADVTGALRVVVRALITWAVEAAALYLILGHLPGVTIVDWQAAVTAILAIGLLNALIRPAVLLAAAN